MFKTNNPEWNKVLEKVRALPKWVPSEEYIAEIKAGGRVSAGAIWENLHPNTRREFRPDLNCDKRWSDNQKKHFEKLWAQFPELRGIYW